MLALSAVYFNYQELVETRRPFLMSEPMDMPASNKQMPSADRSFFGHPRGLSTLFFTEMWERFSFYGLRPLLVLFMSTAIMSGGFGIPRSQASAIVGIYA